MLVKDNNMVYIALMLACHMSLYLAIYVKIFSLKCRGYLIIKSRIHSFAATAAVIYCVLILHTQALFWLISYAQK